MRQQPNPRQFDEDMRACGNLLFLLADSHATCITMFIRHSFGTNRPGLSGVMAAVMLLMIYGQCDPVPCRFMIAWFVALVCQRIRTFYLVRHGWQEHSQYTGWPWLAMLGGTKTEMIGKKMEPVLCFAVGLLLLPMSPTLGCFVMFGCVSFTIVLATQMIRNRRQVVAMRDLRIEQQQLSERLRGFRDDF